MNTIPSIFNYRQVDYTVLCAKEITPDSSMDLTWVLLNRNGSLFRNIALESLCSKKIQNIICVERNTGSSTLDSASHKFPSVKFLIVQEDVTEGELVNIAMAEAKTRYVCVVQDDLCSSLYFSDNLYSKLVEMNQFCVVPRLTTPTMQNIPVRFVPSVSKSVFTVESILSVSDNSPTLYASDWAGFYQREIFMELGGADYTIKNPYWQKMDLFFRAWLWGERVSISTALSFSYSGDVPEENRSADEHYIRFYLKNLLPVFVNDHGHIPAGSFFAYKSRCKLGFSQAMEEFKEARKWTEKNKYRFKTDAAGLIQNWDKGHF